MDLPPDSQGDIDGSEAGDGEKFLFWQVAKKLCSQRRRAERSAAMKAYRQCLEPAVLPTEIIAGGSGSASTADVVDLDNLLMPSPAPSASNSKTQAKSVGSSLFDLSNLITTRLDEEDEEDAESCVSDVTRELPDFDAPTLYPSLELLDEEVPDLLVKEGKPGKIEVSSHCSRSSTTRHRQNFNSNNAPASVGSGLIRDSISSRNSAIPEELDLLSQHLANLTPKSPPATTTTTSQEDASEAHLQHIMRSKSSNNSSSYCKFKPTRAEQRETSRMQSEGGFQGGAQPDSLASASAHAYLTAMATSVLPMPKNRRAVSESTPVQPQRRLSMSSATFAENNDAPMLPQLRRTCTESSPVPPRRRRTQEYEPENEPLPMPDYKRNVSESSPVPPKRKPSKESDDDESQDDDQKTEKSLLSYLSSNKDMPMPPLRRTGTESSPVPPQRRLSLDSRMSNYDDHYTSRTPTRSELGYEDISVYGRPQVRQTDRKSRVTTDSTPRKRDSFIAPPQRRQSESSYFQQNNMPSPEELGYDKYHTDAQPPVSAASPRLPCRRNSFSSFVSNGDDNSTIATWTLGLYQRRKSVDSSVAPWTSTLMPTWTDTTPTRPQRRFSASSLMREQLALTESRWNICHDEREQPRRQQQQKQSASNNHSSFMSSLTLSNHSIGLDSEASSADRRGNRSSPPHKRKGHINQKVPGQSTRKAHNKYRQQQLQGEIRPVQRTHTTPRRHKSWCSTTSRDHLEEEETPLELEIQPGLYLPFRGKKETNNAMTRKFVTPTSCMACDLKLVCIADAEYILCPVCRVVSPVLTNMGAHGGGGVGLGVVKREEKITACKKAPRQVNRRAYNRAA